MLRYLLAFLSVVVSFASTAEAEDFSPRPLIRNLFLLEAMGEHCESVPAAQRGEIKKLAERLSGELVASLQARAAKINPSMTESARAKGISAYLDAGRHGAKAIFADGAACAQFPPSDVPDALRLFGGKAVAKSLSDYGTEMPVYDELRQVFQFPKVRSYASLTQQVEILDTVFGQLADAGKCKNPQLLIVELAAKHVKDVDNLPPFIGRPFQYEERWRFDCGGQEHLYNISFAADSDGPIGMYKVEAVAK